MITLEEFSQDLASKLAKEKLYLGRDTAFYAYLKSPSASFAPDFAMVAWAGERPIGWACVGTTRGKKPYYPIIGVFVGQNARGKGLATQLVSECLSEYKALCGDTAVRTAESELVMMYSADGFSRYEQILERAGFVAFDFDSVRTDGQFA